LALRAGRQSLLLVVWILLELVALLEGMARRRGPVRTPAVIHLFWIVSCARPVSESQGWGLFAMSGDEAGKGGSG